MITKPTKPDGFPAVGPLPFNERVIKQYEELMAKAKTVFVPTSFDLDMIRALQFAYYCHHKSIVPDHEFDQMESEYSLLYGKTPVGSEKPSDYTEAQRALALYFMFSGRMVQSSLL